jgi:predicted chitinase
MDKAFFDAVREPLFSGALTTSQVARMNAIASAWQTYGDGDLDKLAYIFGTAHHETGRFVHMREIWGPTSAQSRYEGRADLGNNRAGDGKKFMGRGFVQITGRRNYTDWSDRLNLDLVANPARAEDAAIAAQILVRGMMLGTFTGRKLADYVGGGNVDFTNARRIVNGTDKAKAIAAYADLYRKALTGAAIKPGGTGKTGGALAGAGAAGGTVVAMAATETIPLWFAVVFGVLIVAAAGFVIYRKLRSK